MNQKKAGVNYARNPAPSYCCPVCSARHGRHIGNTSDCGHSQEEKEKYRELEKGKL